LAGDIYADQACTLQLSVSPDGDNYGTPSELDVPAGENVRFEYSGLFSRTVKVVVTNGAIEMTAFRLFIRGGA
jgi:urease beta subunit